MSSAKLKITAPGLYQQRNGHIANIQRAVQFSSEGATVPCWFGHCVQCGEKRTWFENGAYAVSGKHDWDLVSAE